MNTTFRALLNVHTDVNPNLANSMPQSPVQQWMVAIPTLDKVRLAMSLLSSGKAPGTDGNHPDHLAWWPETTQSTPQNHHNSMGYQDSPTRLEGCLINNSLQTGR